MPDDGLPLDEPETGSNVLLLVPSTIPEDPDACLDLLTVEDPSQENVLCVDYTRTVKNRIDRLESQPTNCKLITAGEEPPDTDDISIELDVDTRDPRDLTGLGVEITEPLENWDQGDNQNVFCFHSLTALLQYTDPEQAYRFLNVLTGHMSSADTIAHYHMNPAAHDQQTLSSLTLLFDVIAEFDDGWEIEGI